MSTDNLIGAYSEDQVSRLTGLSRGQLSSWRRSGFISPSYQQSDNPRKPFNYIYSFRDLLTLRVINKLRNVHGVPLSELRNVAKELRKLGVEDFHSRKLWVLNRKVVFKEPETLKFREISTKQFVADIPLDVVISDAREDIKKLNQRSDNQVGQIIKKRHVVSSKEVFAGTRVPLDSVLNYLENGKTHKEILLDFPTLRQGDIAAASRRLDEAA